MPTDERATPALPGAGLNLQDPATAIDLFDRAAAANLESELRQGAVVNLPAVGRVLMTGDLHDHGQNLLRILKLAQLERPDHYLILHEVIHGEHHVNRRDLSVRMLARAAALKLGHPRQVHFLLANHDLAQLRGEGILKDSVNVVEAYERGVDFIFGDEAERVREAMARFIRSMPLAVRCPEGVVCCHSLPSPARVREFDPGVLARVPDEKDLAPGGSAYLMVWGRNHDDATAQALAKAWDARLFIMGHQPADMGYEVQGQRMLILASDHEHGVALPIDLPCAATLDELVERIIPLAAVTL